ARDELCSPCAHQRRASRTAGQLFGAVATDEKLPMAVATREPHGCDRAPLLGHRLLSCDQRSHAGETADIRQWWTRPHVTISDSSDRSRKRSLIARVFLFRMIGLCPPATPNNWSF